MEQAGILGNLMKYDEFTYSKMLTQGYKIGFIEAKASTAPTTENDNIVGQGSSKDQQQYIRQLNKSFSQQQWDIKLPLYDSNTIWELEDQLDAALEYARKLGPSHGPYFLIGNAAGMLLNGLSDDDVLNRIQKINITFSFAEVKEQTLLEVLKDISARTDMTSPNHQNVLTPLKRTLQACHDHRVILFLCATPKDLPRLNVGREFEALKEAISTARLGDGYRIESVHSCRLQDITKALRTSKPTILHFSGHADTSGLAFEDVGGDYSPIELSRLVDVMKQGAANNLRCVLLNACATAEQSDCIANEVGCVVAMKDAVGDDAAITFTHVFYSALAAGHTIQTAFDWAQPEVKLLHKDSIRPQIIKGGTSSTSSDLGKRAKPQAKNEMSGLASLDSGLKTLQIEAAPVKVVHAGKSTGEPRDEDEESKDENESVFRTPSPANTGLSSSALSSRGAPAIIASNGSDAGSVTSPVSPNSDGSTKAMEIPPSSDKNITTSVSTTNSNVTSQMAAENKIVDPKSSLAQSAVLATNVQKPQEKYGPAVVGARGSPHPPTATTHDGGPSPAKESMASLPPKPQSTTSPQPQVLQPAVTNMRPNTVTSAPPKASTTAQVKASLGGPASKPPAGTSPSLRPSPRPTPADYGRQGPLHSQPSFNSLFDSFFPNNHHFLNDSFFNGMFNQPRVAPLRSQQQQQQLQQRQQQQQEALLVQRAEMKVRQASACDSCERPFADDLRITCEQCNDCSLVACSTCATTDAVPCVRNKHKVRVFKKEART